MLAKINSLRHWKQYPYHLLVPLPTFACIKENRSQSCGALLPTADANNIFIVDISR
jgi:hypothetical protein